MSVAGQVLAGQDRAVANARAAATTMARQRVERERVELFLEGLEEPRRLVQPAAAVARHARRVAPR
jgi:hypothetical protein